MKLLEFVATVKFHPLRSKSKRDPILSIACNDQTVKLGEVF